MSILIFMIIDNDEKKRFAAKAALFLVLTGIVVLVYFLYGTGGKKVLWSVPAPVAPVQLSDSSFPSRIIDLSNWKLTLPMASDNSDAPQDILQPELATYQNNSWFTLTEDKKGVIFRAPVNAQTTANSSYPRSELREMTNDGAKEFFWPSITGTHTMFIDEAITATPKHKPDVVAGQIHGDDSDLIVVRLEGSKLFLARNKADLFTLDDNYILGKRFTVKFVVSDGKVMVYYNNSASPVYTLDKKVKMAYFKAGVYTQSNCDTEGSPELCAADNYGEVVIYQLNVNHQ